MIVGDRAFRGNSTDNRGLQRLHQGLQSGFTSTAIHAKASNDNGTCRATDGGGQALDGRMVSTDSTIPALGWLWLWEPGGFMLHDSVRVIEMHRARTDCHGELRGAVDRPRRTVVGNRERAFGDGAEKLFLIDALARQMAIQVVRIPVRKQQQWSAFEQGMSQPIDDVGSPWPYTDGAHPWPPLQHAIRGGHDCRC